MQPSRKTIARRYALQALYQWQLQDGEPTFETLLSQFTDKRMQASYFSAIVAGVLTDHQAIDKTMAHALDRPLADLNPVECAILRLATWELLNKPEIPYRVVIAEAIDLSRRFGSEEGYRYINAVLDALARHLRQDELQVVGNE